MLRPQHLLRPRTAAAGARRDLEPAVQYPCAISASRCAAQPSPIERLQANTFVPSDLTPIAPSFRLWRSSVTVEELDDHGRALSRRGAHTLGLRDLRRGATHQPRAQGRGRFPPGALRRAYSRLGDRRRLVAAGAVAAAAQAHGLDQGGAEAARRRQCGDPVQPRNPADRARSRAPGHRRLRQGSAADLLEPAVRRNPRPAAEPDPRRCRPCRHPALQQPARRRRADDRIEDFVQRADRTLCLRQRAVPGALRRRAWSSRCAPTACRTAASSPPSPTSRRASKPPKRWSAPTKRWSGACASAPRN